MTGELITRKELRGSFDKFRQEDWGKAAVKLGLLWFTSYGKGSHCLIWDPAHPEVSDIKGRIATVQKNLYKEANKSIFKNIRKFGIQEDDIWRALGELT